MRKRSVAVGAILALFILTMPAVADVGRDVSDIREQVAKQDATVQTLQDQISMLLDRVKQLEEDNQQTRAYAQSLEKQLRKGGSSSGAINPGVAASECASTSCRTFLNDIGTMKVGLMATSVIGHVESGEGNEDDVASGSVNLYLEGPIADNAVFHLNLEGIGGNWDSSLASLGGLNADAGSLQSSDGVDRLQIREAKVQAAFFEEKLTAYIGKIDPTAYFDGNEAANDENSQFLAGALVNNPTFTGIIDGGYVPGFGMYYDCEELLPGLVLGVGVFSRDNSGESIFDNLMGIFEVDYATDLIGLPGNYRAYTYVAASEGAPDPNTGDDDAFDDDAGMGFGLSFDQKITNRIMVFGRFGYNGNDLASGHRLSTASAQTPLVNDALSFGLQIEDPLKDLGMKRANDVFGAGYTQLSLFDLSTDADEASAENEYLVELYYRWQLNGQIAISPFIQFVKQVGGDKDRDLSTIFGVRSSLEF